MKINYVAEFTGTGTTHKQPRKVLNESVNYRSGYSFGDGNRTGGSWGGADYELEILLDWELALENGCPSWVDDQLWDEMYTWMQERANKGDFDIETWLTCSYDDSTNAPYREESGLQDGEKERIKDILQEFGQKFSLDEEDLNQFVRSFNVELDDLGNSGGSYHDEWQSAIDSAKDDY